jgi:hypothetical protein
MHDINNIKFKDAEQSKAIYNFKNIEKKNFIGPTQLVVAKNTFNFSDGSLGQ